MTMADITYNNCIHKELCDVYALFGVTDVPADDITPCKLFKSADVVEVVRGEWIRPTMINGRTFDIPHCSACGDVPCDTKNYCPECGAKMDAERKCEE